MAHVWHWSIARAACGAALLLAHPAFAASPGSPGPTSRGSITITVSVAAGPRVTGLTDLSLDGAASASAATRELCVTGAPHAYTVAASGSGPDGALSLTNGDDSIAYRVEWLTEAGNGGLDPQSGNAPATIQAVGNRAQCGTAQGTGQLRIALDSADAARMQGDTAYSGTLVLTLAPD